MHVARSSRVNAGEDHAGNEKRGDWELGGGGCLCRAYDSFTCGRLGMLHTLLLEAY